MSTDSGSEAVFYLLVGGPIALVWGLRTFNEKRLLENTPTSKVRSAAMGLVELAGQAIAGKPQKSPLSLRDCCWWKCQVQEYRSTGKSSQWVTIQQSSSTELFYLQDETGRVLVNPANAELHVPSSIFSLNAATRAQVAPVLNGWGIDGMNWFGGWGARRIIEEVIYAQAPLFVMGELVNTPSTPNGDYVQLRAPVNSPFVVSTKPEKDLLNSFMWLAPLGIFGGIAMGGAGTWLGLTLSWNPFVIVGFLAAGFLVSFFWKTFKLTLGRN